jgi:hypothetical protein
VGTELVLLWMMLVFGARRCWLWVPFWGRVLGCRQALLAMSEEATRLAETTFCLVRKPGNEEQMSRGNILNMEWLPEDAGLLVTFELHHGTEGGTRTYLYDPTSGEAIENGADPQNFAGQQVS